MIAEWLRTRFVRECHLFASFRSVWFGFEIRTPQSVVHSSLSFVRCVRLAITTRLPSDNLIRSSYSLHSFRSVRILSLQLQRWLARSSSDLHQQQAAIHTLILALADVIRARAAQRRNKPVGVSSGWPLVRSASRSRFHSFVLAPARPIASSPAGSASKSSIQTRRRRRRSR